VGDLGLALKLPGAALIATTVKPAHWERAAGMADGVASRLGNSGGRADERTIERYLGASAGVPSARSIRKGLQRNQRLNQLHYVASWCPGGWSPTIDLVGAEHLHAALAGGRGAVLWVAPLVFAPLVAKRALHEGGFSVHHLSRPNHGFSSTRFGVAVLNPVRTRVEDRYLAERITISKANETTAAVRALADRLATNRIISITMTSLGMRQADVPFLDGRVRVAPGAARLAQR
jgi:hypothetical protein